MAVWTKALLFTTVLGEYVLGMVTAPCRHNLASAKILLFLQHPRIRVTHNRTRKSAACWLAPRTNSEPAFSVWHACWAIKSAGSDGLGKTSRENSCTKVYLTKSKTRSQLLALFLCSRDVRWVFYSYQKIAANWKSWQRSQKCMHKKTLGLPNCLHIKGFFSLQYLLCFGKHVLYNGLLIKILLYHFSQSNFCTIMAHSRSKCNYT